MRKRIIWAVLLAVITACSTTSTQNNDPWGKVDPGQSGQQATVLNLSMRSSSMGRTMTYSVWLPAGYDESKTYPFFYLLHGYETDDQNGQFNRCWLDKGNAAYIAKDYQKSGGVPMVIVMPNGLNKFYHADGYEAFFEEELMAKVEADYHCNGKRAIGGLSMGGYGTIFHALKYPEKFTCAYAMSPAAKMWGHPDPKEFIGLQADKSVFPPFTFEVGTEDRTVSNADTRSLKSYMTSQGIPCQWIERAGTHDWDFWKACLPKALQEVGASFQ